MRQKAKGCIYQPQPGVAKAEARAQVLLLPALSVFSFLYGGVGFDVRQHAGPETEEVSGVQICGGKTEALDRLYGMS
jgi:hypothetical protein